MTRRMPIVNGAQINTDAPPPSTLAAQLVQNQARINVGPPQSGEAATFTQLLQEILADSNVAPETDVNVNIQLICVVAEAGLAPLAQDVPSNRFDELITQAKDSIAVIESTIKRQPEVLFTQVGEDGPQLLLSLLAHLVALCGKHGCHDLPIPSLFDTAVSAVMKSANLWHMVNVLKQALWDILNGE